MKMKMLKIQTWNGPLYFLSKKIKISSENKVHDEKGSAISKIADISATNYGDHFYFRATEEAIDLVKDSPVFAPIILIKHEGELIFVSFLEAYELSLINGPYLEYNNYGSESGFIVNKDFPLEFSCGINARDWWIKNINMRHMESYYKPNAMKKLFDKYQSSENK